MGSCHITGSKAWKPMLTKCYSKSAKAPSETEPPSAILKDESKKAEASFISKDFPLRTQVGETGKVNKTCWSADSTQPKTWHSDERHATCRTEHDLRALLPIQVFEEATRQNTCVKGVRCLHSSSENSWFPGPQIFGCPALLYWFLISVSILLLVFCLLNSEKS